MSESATVENSSSTAVSFDPTIDQLADGMDPWADQVLIPMILNQRSNSKAKRQKLARDWFRSELFYQDNGLNMQDIFTLKAIYSVAIVAMEIPSGYMADVWGRRNTLLLGGILASTGFALYSFSEGFWAFALAEIVLGEIGRAHV